MAEVLKVLAFEQGTEVEIDEVDICRDPSQDMAILAHQQKILQAVEQGLYSAILITPPCSTWSRVRGANTRGPPMIRSKQWPWGFPWLARRFKIQIEVGNTLVRFTIQVLLVVDVQSRKIGRAWCAVFAEHPEDLGVIFREEDNKVFYPASIWQLEELRRLVDEESPMQLATIAICQCCFGAPYRKPTRLLSNIPEVKAWGSHEWPSFSHDGRYAGPLVKSCSCTPTQSLARQRDDTAFRTSGTSAYPPEMDRALAAGILRWLMEAPLSASEAGKGAEGGSEIPQKAVSKGEEEVVGAVEAEETTSKGATSRAKRKSQDNLPMELPNLQRGKRTITTGGQGPPILAYYKGDSRPINDGGGICSPGRWRPDKRWGAQGPAALGLRCEVKKLFLRWLSKPGADASKGPEDLFWRMAAGKMQSSPFQEAMDECRKRLDDYMLAEGAEPLRRETDRDTEVNFRRLAAALQLMGDVDYSYLEEVASVGVPIGVEVELPRTEAVFEEKTRWAVEGTEEEYHDVVSENYASAEESHLDIRRQVLEEVEKGSIVKMSMEEAQREFGGRLAIAALGAVPKELNSDRVRLIHDGTYSVDINRRIRVRDRMRFPLIDDAAAVMCSVEDHVDREVQKVRFSMVYDIARAHKLIPVRRMDWGYQAFRLPGPKETPEEESAVYLHTRGTFGVASAAYWWGRCAASAVRLAHNLADEHLGLWHLLFADDGWLTATGRWFWRKILYWFFVLDLFEFPISWKKVSGGCMVQWIGYQLDVQQFTVGISDRKKEWVRSWVAARLKEGGVVGREMRAALGRLTFVAGALRHVRPFLGPLFAWTSMVSGGTFTKMPDAVVILLEFVSMEVERCPMRAATRPPVLEGDCFRIDAKAAGEEIVIGGWESYGNVHTKQARWFSIALSRRTVPWAYLRGDPFRAIASLELLAVLTAIMLFSRDAPWKDGRRKVVLPAFTDNLSNMHVLKKFGSSKFPLSIVAMELACQLEIAKVELDLSWVPRCQNEEADALTNSRYEGFDESRRINVQFEDLRFVLLDRLMTKAGELDSELKLHRTSKEAKRSAMAEEAKTTSKKKKGEMKWKDPW